MRTINTTKKESVVVTEEKLFKVECDTCGKTHEYKDGEYKSKILDGWIKCEHEHNGDYPGEYFRDDDIDFCSVKCFVDAITSTDERPTLDIRGALIEITT